MFGAAVFLSACAGGPPPFAVGVYPPRLDQQVLAEATVERSGTVLLVHNNSQMILGPGRMWVNQEFSHPVDAIVIGETVQFDLSEFRNEFGERFRAGGFWATERPKRVGLVQIEPEADGARLLGLVVVADELK